MRTRPAVRVGEARDDKFGDINYFHYMTIRDSRHFAYLWYKRYERAFLLFNGFKLGCSAPRPICDKIFRYGDDWSFIVKAIFFSPLVLTSDIVRFLR